MTPGNLEKGLRSLLPVPRVPGYPGTLLVRIRELRASLTVGIQLAVVTVVARIWVYLARGGQTAFDLP